MCVPSSVSNRLMVLPAIVHSRSSGLLEGNGRQHKIATMPV